MMTKKGTTYKIIWKTLQGGELFVPYKSPRSFRYLFEEKFGKDAMKNVKQITEKK